MRRFLPLVVVGLVLVTAPATAQTPQAQGPFMQGFIFGDVTYWRTDLDVDDGFKLGQMVFHGNATLSQHVVFFAELSVTARSTGYSLAMERAILRYDFSDALKLSAGRYHTPISYWNTAFHHGLWLQGSVARPEAVRFGSQYIPVHFVGAMAEGNFDAVPLHYAAGVGNGRSENLSGANDAGSFDGASAFVVSGSLRPRNLFGFRVGGGVYHDRLTDGGVHFADELITSGYVVWDRGGVEAIGELINVAHDIVASGESYSSPSWYVHLGYRLPGELRDFTPYARYEDMNIDESDDVFIGALADYQATVVGVRWDFDDLAALKGEYRGEKFDGGGRADSFFVQASFAIPVSGG